MFPADLKERPDFDTLKLKQEELDESEGGSAKDCLG